MVDDYLYVRKPGALTVFVCGGVGARVGGTDAGWLTFIPAGSIAVEKPVLITGLVWVGAVLVREVRVFEVA
jgi:hypothetical protein